jgi:SAM-dependent methyltransferase
VTAAAGTGVGEVFSAARSEFAHWYTRLWRPLGEVAVALSRPQPGERVLDACCGSGASALPAARAVGPTGVVHGVDLAEALIEQGRREAEPGTGREGAADLPQLTFHTADVLQWRDEPYDLVQCLYGVFFFPDIDAGGRHLSDLLRPGGRLTVGTWRRDAMAKLVPIGLRAAIPERPELAAMLERPDTQTRLSTADGLRRWLSSLGLRDVTVDEVTFVQPLHPEDAWSFYLGAAMRGFVEGLDPQALARVKRRFQDGLAEAGSTTLDAGSLIGVGYR